MSSIAEESPLAEQLKTAVQAQAIERAWTQDEDDKSLAEYIVLMVANGKTEEEITSELTNELLQDATGAEEFASWLTNHVAQLTGAGANDNSSQAPAVQEDAPIPAAYDNDLGESAPDNAPKGPKGLHGGPRGSRGGRNSVPGRGSFDSALHRTRGSERINSHTRGAPKGPKTMQNKDLRPGMQKALNGMQGQQMPNPIMPGAQQNGQYPPMSPQEQMKLMQMMEQSAMMLAQFMPNMVPPGMNGQMPSKAGQPGQPGQPGRSMFDRVERGRGGAHSRGRGRGGQSQNGSRKPSEVPTEGDSQSQVDTAMETEGSGPAAGPKDPSSTICYFNLRCLNKECQYAHQGPSAPPGTEIDLSQTCTFGAACKNTLCHGKHPSPATIAAHKAEQECKFFPNCTNPNCPFKHPTMPLCQFGASCNNKDCKFTHLKTKCKFNPCTNARCPFAHEPGQNRNMSAFSWTKDSGSAEKIQESGGTNDHVSTRKFVNEGEEEYIKPQEDQDGQATAAVVPGETQQEEVVT